jgi:hypothetical protein
MSFSSASLESEASEEEDYDAVSIVSTSSHHYNLRATNSPYHGAGQGNTTNTTVVQKLTLTEMKMSLTQSMNRSHISTHPG